MAKTHAPDPPEFPRQLVELVRAGRTLATQVQVFGERQCGDLTYKSSDFERKAWQMAVETAR